MHTLVCAHTEQPPLLSTQPLQKPKAHSEGHLKLFNKYFLLVYEYKHRKMGITWQENICEQNPTTGETIVCLLAVL